MKKTLLLLCFCAFNFLKSQIIDNFDINYFYGNILKHNSLIAPLIHGHPQSIILGLNKKTYGTKEWQKIYNYPDFGLSFMYQNYNSTELGSLYYLAAHYNFYFFKRQLMLRIAEGIGYSTTPYNPIKNSKNMALGSEFLAGTMILLEYKKEYLINNFGLQVGALFNHFSNGSSKVPNSGVNTYGFNIGILYNFEDETTLQHKSIDTLKSFKEIMLFKEPIRYNLSFKSGINQRTPEIPRQPFYHLGFYLDKRLNRKSAIQLGTDLFITKTREELINYERTTQPEKNIPENLDYRRIGIFAGHELFINKLSIETQLGYYIYSSYKKNEFLYTRLGLKYYIIPKLFTSISVKTHFADAEALEFGIGVRL